MNRLAVTLFIIITTVITISAQETKSIIGNSYKYPSRTFHYKFLTKTNESTVLVRKNYKNTVYFLDFFDEKMNFKGTKEIDYNNSSNLEILDISFYKNKVLVLSKNWDRKSNQLTVYGASGSFDNIAKITPKKLGSFTSSREKDINIEVRYPENNSCALISCTYSNESKIAQLNYYVIDFNLNQLDFASIETPNKINDFDVAQCSITNSGDLHFITRSKVNNQYKFNFITLFKSDGQLIERELDFKNETPKYIQFVYKNNNISIVAILSDLRNLNLITTYFLTLNLNNRSFSPPIFTNIKNILNTSPNGSDYNYVLHPILTTENNIFITLEYYNTRVFTSYDAFGTPYTTYYNYYESVVVLCLNSKGEKKWATVIPKYQYSTNDGGYGLGSAVFADKDKLFIYFNSNFKNQKEEKYRLRNVKKSNLVEYSFNTDGKVNHKTIADTRKVGFVFEPRYNFKSNKEVIISGSRGGNSNFMKIYR